MHRIRIIDHVQLAMPPGEEERAEGFYSAILGLPRRPKPPAVAVRGGCWFSNGAVTIHLGTEEGFVPARKAHPALRVVGYDALVDALAAAGYRVRPDEELPGVRRGYVDDPFGNRIVLIDDGAVGR